MPEKLYKIHQTDARKIDTIITTPLVDVTVTSPPYFDMKDYGHADQIGFGQSYTEYLDDLYDVFSKVFACTKDTGTLWVIIDVFRRDGETIPLPFDFANKIKGIGWRLKEVIIWGKDKTVPWAHKGQMRNSFEYVLLFSKSENYTFHIDRVRDYGALKKWWVKYPERYNPRGKTPEAIWNFDIPVQGSWGKGYIKHFCPLPEEMIAQILKLTTIEGDVVLDPFSGSGAVLSKADNMKRRYIGTELNPEYIRMFKNYLKKTGKQKRHEYEVETNGLLPQNQFETLILKLRALKYARIFYEKLKKDAKLDEIVLIFVELTDRTPKKSHLLIVVRYLILIRDEQKLDEVKAAMKAIVAKAPLSKFGIEPDFAYASNFDTFSAGIKATTLRLYTNKVTHTFKSELKIADIANLGRNDIIISEIAVDLNEKDYE
ncbi:site-specific DNA-methyltransferase [Mucilaginibacter sp. Mucisp84]|uniref:DNA-methyltransferase n=1 Tax=Mucilaginibacter sp. Mucisp84 TaxID=3243058 RepID=UPI0039A679B0